MKFIINLIKSNSIKFRYKTPGKYLSTILKSPAKVNLFLHITGKRGDGYHQLQSIFYFPEIYDTITISESKTSQNTISYSGQFGSQLSSENPENNLIFKVFSELEYHGYKLPKFDIHLEKNLPIGAGIGGGSSNAAAVLKYISEKYIKISSAQLLEIAVSLGADVPCFLDGNHCLISGIGEKITRFNDFPNLNILLLNPMVHISTKQIFQMGFSNFTPEISNIPSHFSQDSLIDFLQQTKNDLYPSALELEPSLAKVIVDIFSQDGCLFSNMSGSGSTCFGIFDSKISLLAAQKNLKNIHPNFWCEVSF